MVGRALVRELSNESCKILTVSRDALDLRDQAAVNMWFVNHKPDVVILAAAKVGGIGANSMYPADFLYDNLMIEINVIHAAYVHGVQKLLYLGSSCIYPRDAVQPITEDALMTGALEPTNAPYAVAKIAGIYLCQAYRKQHGCDFISAIPCNLYGVGDTYDAENDGVSAHVVPAMILKMHRAKQNNDGKMELWGTGKPLREFLCVDDLADGLHHMLRSYSSDMPLNIGSGKEISIYDLAHKVAAVTGYKGKIVFDDTKPDGTPRKVLDSTKIKELGWTPSTILEEGLALAYDDFVS